MWKTYFDINISSRDMHFMNDRLFLWVPNLITVTIQQQPCK